MCNDMIGYEGTQESAMPLPSVGWTVTNHLNMFYMLGVGLVLPPSGFGGKYYQDTLARSAGWIPIFLDKKVPTDALALSTLEAEYLRPVILEVQLTGLSVKVSGALKEFNTSSADVSGAISASSCLWLPAPLPTTRITRILFSSKEDKGAVEADATNYQNVPLGDFKRSVLKTAFTHPAGSWSSIDAPAPRETPLHAPVAIGAVSAMLMHFGNRGTLSVRACHAAFDPDESPAIQDDPLGALPIWIRTGSVPTSGDAVSRSPYEKLFWGVVDRLVMWRGDPSLSAEDALLSYLEGQLESLDERAKSGAKKLLDTLVSLTGLGAATASELFARHQTPLARAMILFFLRDRCEDLLDFKNDELHEIDWLVAAVLFGIRDSWLGIPPALREVPGLATAVSDRMAHLSHRMAGTDLLLGALSPRVKPLLELLATDGEWNSRQDAIVQELVRIHGWNCATTRISLPPGTYKVTVSRGGTHIDVAGEPKIARVVDKASFFDLLARNTMKPNIEARLRKRFSG